jgi:hypothetical protein
LKAGLSRINLTEEQKETLTHLHPDTFNTFPLTNQQKTILQALTPLTKEDKYSEDSLDLFYQEITLDKEGNRIRKKP